MKAPLSTRFKKTITYLLSHEPFFPFLQKVKIFRREDKVNVYGPSSLKLVTEIQNWLSTNLPEKELTETIGENFLIESSYSDPTSNYNSLLTYDLLQSSSKNYKKCYVLVNHKADPAVAFWKAAGLNKIICFTDCLSLGVRLKAGVTASRQFAKCKVSKFSGFKCEIDRVNLGDLIIEDIIRQTGFPTVSKKGALLFAAMYNACLKYLVFQKILKKFEINEVIATHNVYIHFGTLLKACKNQASFWLWAGTRLFGMYRIKPRGPESSAPPYQISKADLGNILERGDGWIETEFLNLVKAEFGGTYVKNFDDITVYQKTEINNEEEFLRHFSSQMVPGKNIFVMSHVLIDSVNTSPWRIFSDYFHWLKETLEILTANPDCNVFVKPHPSDAYYASSVNARQVLEMVNQTSQKKAIFLDKKVSNQFLYDFADAFVTCSGTIASQGPCFGIPTITAAGTSSEVAQTTYTAHSYEEYKRVLQNAHALTKPSGDQMLKAKAAYIWQSRLIFSETKLNVLNNFVTDSTSEGAFKEILNSLRSIQDINSDELIINFHKSFIRRNREQLLSFSILDKTDDVNKEIKTGVGLK